MNPLKEKTLLVLGCGYLGGRIVEDARRTGMRVKAISRNAQSLRRAEELGAECFIGQIEERGWHDFAGEGIDCVVNCVSSAGGGLAGYTKSYIEGNESLGDWADQVGFRGRAIYTSSVSVYADAGGQVVSEECARQPTTERGRLMLESEGVFRARLAEASPIVLRLAGLYGPGRHLLLDRLLGRPETLEGWGDYYLNLVRIEDVVTAVMTCLESVGEPEASVYNIVDDCPSLKVEITNWLAERLSVSQPKYSGRLDEGTSSRRFGDGSKPGNRRVSNERFKAAFPWAPRFPSFREGFGGLIQADRARG